MSAPNLRNVSQAEFFAALKQDPRDIMPTTNNPDVTVWEVQRDRSEWGRSTPGWRSPSGTPHEYFLTTHPEQVQP